MLLVELSSCPQSPDMSRCFEHREDEPLLRISSRCKSAGRDIGKDVLRKGCSDFPWPVLERCWQVVLSLVCRVGSRVYVETIPEP